MTTLKDLIKDFAIEVQVNDKWSDEDLEVKIEELLEDIKGRLIG
ncbi:MAG TPA: hypothetical protein VF974_07690 [Patescibacteria group bacterium]